MWCSFAILTCIHKDFDLQQFLEASLSFFVLKNCVVSLVTLQNGTCEQLATRTTDF